MATKYKKGQGMTKLPPKDWPIFKLTTPVEISDDGWGYSASFGKDLPPFKSPQIKKLVSSAEKFLEDNEIEEIEDLWKPVPWRGDLSFLDRKGAIWRKHGYFFTPTEEYGYEKYKYSHDLEFFLERLIDPWEDWMVWRTATAKSTSPRGSSQVIVWAENSALASDGEGFISPATILIQTVVTGRPTIVYKVNVNALLPSFGAPDENVLLSSTLEALFSVPTVADLAEGELRLINLPYPYVS